MDTATQVHNFIEELPGWQRNLAARIRELIHEADPHIREEWKWGTPVFVRNGNVCAIGAFRDHLKVNFFKGAALSDPGGLLNAGLEAKTSRAIDLADGDGIDEEKLRALVREAVTLDG